MTPVLHARDPAYILAGGRSSRFGSDKARAMLEGRPLIRRIADMLEARGHKVVAVARDADRYADLAIETVADIEPDLGPIGGLETALAHRLQTNGPGWAVLTSCDLINPSPEMLGTLESLRERSPETEAVAFKDDRWQPFPGLYHTQLLDRLHTVPARSLQKLLSGARAAAAEAPKDLRQANRPSDLEAFDGSD